jgi:hypothetical protein
LRRTLKEWETEMMVEIVWAWMRIEEKFENDDESRHMYDT